MKKFMKKFMKKQCSILMAITLAVGCTSVLPVNAKNGSSVKTNTPIERTDWKGYAWDINSREEHALPDGHNNDGPMKFAFDGNVSTVFHTNYNSGNTVSLPLYIFIDLGKSTQFQAFEWVNRTNQDAAKKWEMYVNNSETSLIPDSGKTDGYEFSTDWGKAIGSGEFKRGQSNKVNLNRVQNAKEILIVVRENYGNNFVTCAEFNLFSERFQSIDDEMELMDLINASVTVGSVDRNDVTTSGDTSIVVNKAKDNYFEFVSANSTADNPVASYVQINMGSSRSIKKVIVDVYDAGNSEWDANRTYQDVVIVASSSENFSDGNVVLMNCDPTNKTGFGGSETDGSGVEILQQNEIIAYVNKDVEAQYLRVYMNGTNNVDGYQNKILPNHIYEIEVYGDVTSTETPIDMTSTGINATVTVDCVDGYAYGLDTGYSGSDYTDEKRNSVVVDGKIQGDTDAKFLAVEASSPNADPGAPISVTIDMKSVYNIDKIGVDVYHGRTYNNVVIVTSDTLSGFDRANEHYVLYNTDSTNKSGFGGEKSLDQAQQDYITAYAQEFVTGRYVRVYMNGSTANKGNHIFEIQVWGTQNEDSSTTAKDEFVLEGFYADNTFNTAATTDIANPVSRYVTNKVLGVKAQVRAEENGTRTIRLVSSVASLTPNKVGFTIQLNDGKIKDYDTTTVYGKILASDQMVEPRTVFGNNASDYFSAIKITGVPGGATGTLKVTPYWWVGEEKVCGAQKEYSVADLLNSINN